MMPCGRLKSQTLQLTSINCNCRHVHTEQGSWCSGSMILVSTTVLYRMQCLQFPDASSSLQDNTIVSLWFPQAMCTSTSNAYAAAELWMNSSCSMSACIGPCASDCRILVDIRHLTTHVHPRHGCQRDL